MPAKRSMKMCKVPELYMRNEVCAPHVHEADEACALKPYEVHVQERAHEHGKKHEDIHLVRHILKVVHVRATMQYNVLNRCISKCK